MSGLVEVLPFRPLVSPVNPTGTGCKSLPESVVSVSLDDELVVGGPPTQQQKTPPAQQQHANHQQQQHNNRVKRASANNPSGIDNPKINPRFVSSVGGKGGGIQVFPVALNV